MKTMDSTPRTIGRAALIALAACGGVFAIYRLALHQLQVDWDWPEDDPAYLASNVASRADEVSAARSEASWPSVVDMG